MKVLVAGLGYVGAALFERLDAAGHEVWGLRRHPNHSHDRVIAANATTGDGLDQLPSDIEQIAIAISPDGRTKEAYDAAYPQAIKRLTRHFPSARLLLVGSTSVYAQKTGEILDEVSPALSEAFTAKSILEAEALVLNHSASNCVLRASGIYGPTRTRMVSRFAHESPSVDEAAIWTNRIHRDDLAGALAFLMLRPTLGGIFVTSDPNPAQLAEIAIWVQAHPAKDKLAKNAPPPKKSTRTRANRRFHPTRLLTEGFSFRYPSFKDGYAEALDSL